MLKIKIMTLFPEYFGSFLSTSIIKRAIAKGVVSFELYNIRDYTKDRHHRVDDRPVGGGAGLIMKMQPLTDCLDAIATEDSYKVLFSPLGRPFSQEKAVRLSEKKELILICGHYEGIDARFSAKADELISIGDYITTGGEVAALAVSDAVVRLLKGAIADESTLEESFASGLLEYPQYTLPNDFEGQKIPPVLFSGNHEAIRIWRQREALRLTKELRPDLFASYKLSKADLRRLRELESGEISKTEKTALAKGERFLKPEDD